MPLEPTTEEIQAARDLAADLVDEGWIQHFMFANWAGDQPRSCAGAERVCAMGAIVKATSMLTPAQRGLTELQVGPYKRTLQRFVVRTVTDEAGIESLTAYNDAEGRTSAEVAKILRG